MLPCHTRLCNGLGQAWLPSPLLPPPHPGKGWKGAPDGGSTEARQPSWRTREKEGRRSRPTCSNVPSRAEEGLLFQGRPVAFFQLPFNLPNGFRQREVWHRHVGSAGGSICPLLGTGRERSLEAPWRPTTPRGREGLLLPPSPTGQQGGALTAGALCCPPACLPGRPPRSSGRRFQLCSAWRSAVTLLGCSFEAGDELEAAPSARAPGTLLPLFRPRV